MTDTVRKECWKFSSEVLLWLCVWKTVDTGNESSKQKVIYMKYFAWVLYGFFFKTDHKDSLKCLSSAVFEAMAAISLPWNQLKFHLLPKNPTDVQALQCKWMQKHKCGEGQRFKNRTRRLQQEGEDVSTAKIKDHLWGKCIDCCGHHPWWRLNWSKCSFAVVWLQTPDWKWRVDLIKRKGYGPPLWDVSYVCSSVGICGKADD